MKLNKILKEIDEKKSGLKYECRFLNGGFNSGVKIEPTSGGKLSLSISIYGGGDPKSITVPAKGELESLVKSYEIAFKNKDQLGTKLEPKLDGLLTQLEEDISLQIIEALQEFDLKVKQIIINNVKG